MTHSSPEGRDERLGIGLREVTECLPIVDGGIRSPVDHLMPLDC